LAPVGNQDEQEGMSEGAQLLQGGAAIQRTQTNYTSAIVVQKPRKKAAVLAACLDEAGLAGESFFYAWTVKDKQSPTGESLVEGIGIEGAMILARNWGNCTIPISIESETPVSWVLRAAFVDFETGFNLERLFRQRKGQESAKYDVERKLDINFQIGQSKAHRNVIVKALPAWLKEQSIEAAKDAAAGKYKEVEKHIPKFVREFSKLGVDKARLEKKIGLPVEQWEPRDLVTLAAIGRAIKDRQTTVEDEFPPDTQTVGRTVVEGEFVEENSGGPAVSSTVQAPAVQSAPTAAPAPPAAQAAPAAVSPPEVPELTPPDAAKAAAPPAPAATTPEPAKAVTEPSGAPAGPAGPISAAEAAEIAAAERAEAERAEAEERNAAPAPTTRKRNREMGED